ncbi:MAG TPA: hypothetical protein VGE15_12305 [Sphingobacteriaceae bacterium]
MHKGLFSGLFFFLLCIILTGCSSMYVPNVPNTPMLSADGELHAAAHISLKGNASFNSAYAVSDHFSVMLNGSFMNRDRERRDFSQNLLEAAGGYYTTFGSEGSRILEIYSGLGRGSSLRVLREVTTEGLVSNERQQVSFSKFFLQANYSSKRKKSLKLFGTAYPINYGTALRISHMKMRDFKVNDIKQEGEDNIFFEPVFFTRLQLNRAVQLQYTSGSNFGLKNRDYLTAGSSVFTLGIAINVGGIVRP